MRLTSSILKRNPPLKSGTMNHILKISQSVSNLDHILSQNRIIKLRQLLGNQIIPKPSTLIRNQPRHTRHRMTEHLMELANHPRRRTLRNKIINHKLPPHNKRKRHRKNHSAKNSNRPRQHKHHSDTQAGRTIPPALTGDEGRGDERHRHYSGNQKVNGHQTEPEPELPLSNFSIDGEHARRKPLTFLDVMPVSGFSHSSS
nr:MAG TPA: hypothetical protein [Caudoviricetes sp.]